MMQRRILLIIVLALCTSVAFSKHLKGGWIHYEYLGKGAEANTSQYSITINQYLLCSSQGGQIDNEVYLGIFDAVTNSLVTVKTIFHTDFVTEEKTDFDPCISNPPEICYRIDRYTATITLPDNDAGYILGVQRCCRIDGIKNLVNSQQAGITYSVSIPGIINGNSVRNNYSPIFSQNDLAVICINSFFTLNFSATDDVDNDSLVYSFCPGLIGGDDSNTPQGTQPNPPSNPPFSTVTYASSFSGSQPLGSKVSIDSKTGIISGTAPSVTGEYVIAVCITEYRQGIAIAQSRKEIHISVANCQLSGAELAPSYSTCDGFTFTFENESMASNINSYLWSFGFKDTTSTDPKPTITFPEAGQYTITLNVKNANGCSDNAKSILNVFPGFFPDFSVTGSCLQNKFSFTDKSATVYGVVDGWTWNFGDPNNLSDTSHLQTPLPYQYSQTGTISAQLIVTNSKGCIDTLNKEVTIYDKPIITMPFRDTLICNIDRLQLSASTSAPATYTWTPVSNITNANTKTPTVNPQTTTTYFVNVDAGSGCVNNDSVKVNVLSQVSLVMPGDTTICLTDSVQLSPVSDALHYLWTPSETLSDNAAQSPVAIPVENTVYHLQANVGACSANGDITVYTAPYPQAKAASVLPVCYGFTTLLNASFTGTSFTWSPVNTLLNANTLTPTAGPTQTTLYTFTALDNSLHGCPKPVSDTVRVVVIPPIVVYAGRDTNIVVGQSLQLQATGAKNYHWSPPTGMSNVDIFNPVVNLPQQIQRITYSVKGTTAEGCSGYDSLNVYQYKTLPEIFVPSAFTPDGNGINDILKPIVAGMKKFENFSVYNRLGQLLYTTASIGEGWDGNFKGIRQPPGTYVFVATAIDYLDRHVVRKGTAVLIR